MEKVFVYGTLKRGYPNAHLMENNKGRSRASFIGECITEHPYPLVIAGRYNTPYVLDAKGQGKKIKGELFEVDEEMVKTLDALEEVPIYYQRDKMEVRIEQSATGSELVTCWCYFLRNFKPELLDLECLSDFDPKACSYVPIKDRPKGLGKVHHDDVLLATS